MKKLILVSMAAALAASSFAGCDAERAADASGSAAASAPAQSVVKGELQTALMEGRIYIPPEKQMQEVVAVQFDLGADLYKSESGEMPFRVRGTLSMPAEGENLPLVILLHGSHDNENPEAKLYEGFAYLTEKLAARGFAAVTLDVQSAFVWSYGDGGDDVKSEYILNAFLQRFADSAAGKTDLDAGLVRRIAADRLILAGHSRGGDNVLDYAAKMPEVIGVLAIDPAGGRMSYETRDIPIAMLVSSLDGDVGDYGAYKYWPAILESKRENPAVITFVDGANHNYFNAKLTKNDAQIGYYKEDELSKQITAEQQQTLLADYAADFCDLCVGQQESGSLFDLSQQAITEMDGVKIRSIYDEPQLSPCLDVSEKVDCSPLTVENLLDAESIHTDTMQAFESGMDNLPVLHIAWDAQHGTMPAAADGTDFANAAGLVLTYAVDPGSEQNEGGVPQSFSVQLVHKDGDITEVVLPDTLPQMESLPGELYDDTYDGVRVLAWSRVTPPSAVILPFADYGIDGSELAEVRLNFNQTDRGSIVLLSSELIAK